MNIIDRFVSGREVGVAIPVSIGTAIAVETALGLNPEIKVDKAPILEAKLLFINVRTLIRNLMGALTTDGKRLVNEKNLIPALIEEMGIIEAGISKETHGKINVAYYVCSYKSLKQHFPNALLRTPTTEIQKFAHAIEVGLLKNLQEISPPHDIRYFDVTIVGKFPDTFIMTHSPVDLLSVDSFTKLTLLESHTGKMKRHLLWNTKLTNGKELVNIPFTRFTLQVFGDNGGQFAPLAPKIKQAVKDVAEKYSWSSITTKDKVNYGISSIEDKVIRSTLKGLL